MAGRSATTGRTKSIRRRRRLARSSTEGAPSSSVPRYTFGNAGRNILTGPGYASLDLAVAKGIPLGATRRLEARIEIYNALNRANLGLPDGFVDRSTFGRALSASPAREGQLVARFTF